MATIPQPGSGSSTINAVWLQRLGQCLALLGSIFFAVKLLQYWQQLNPAELSAQGIIKLLAVVLLACCSNCLLVLAWRQLLAIKHYRLSNGQAFYVYGRSLLAKYIPGNIFQVASRQALGLAQGIPGNSLAWSSLAELVLIAAVGGSFLVLLLPMWWQTISATAVNALFVTAWLAILSILFGSSRELCFTLLGYLVFFLISGLSFLLVANAVTDPAQIDNGQLIRICAAVVIAWLAGLITPGAPAGMGVREALLLGLLQHYWHTSDLLLIILISRITTSVGDCVFYLLCNLAIIDQEPIGR